MEDKDARVERQAEMGTNDDTHRMLNFERAASATKVSDVQISPDGQQVAYVTTPASKEGEYPVSEIWLVPAAGGPSRRLTASEAADAAPRWSPDGKHIVFTSDRRKRGTPQLYLLDLAGGEALRLTDSETGVGPASWSPDGKMLAFTRQDAETEEEKQRKESGDDIKVVDRDIWYSGLWLLDVPGDPATEAPDHFPESRRLSPEGMHFTSPPAWAPDGSRLIAIVSPSPKPHDTYLPDLYTFSLDGEAKDYGRFGGLLPTPKFSPDGSVIAFSAAEDDFPALYSIQTIPADWQPGTGQPHIVAPGYEGSFYGFDWLPDGKRIIVGLEEGQRDGVKVLDLETGDVSDAFEPLETPGSGSLSLFSVSADGKRLAFVHANARSYGDVYIADTGGAARRLTELNPWLRDYEFGETREISWTAPDGLEIQGLITLPVDYEEGKSYPLVVQIHGGPQMAWKHELQAGITRWAQILAQRGYAVFMPNPRGSSGRGTGFLCAIVGCYGEPDSDDIMSGVDYLIEQGIADPDQLVVGGWSGGGFLTNWAITHTDRFKAAISGAGVTNWVSFQGTTDARSVFDCYLGSVTEQVDAHWRLSPIRSIKQATTPTLILHGESDSRVPVSQAYELYEGLKAVGVETQMVAYPRGGHVMQERSQQIDVMERVVGWYDRHLGRNTPG